MRGLALKVTVWTVGHSTRERDEFVSLLRSHNIEVLMDVRTVPRSRRNPQFNKDALPDELGRFSIEYLHMSGLGGLRRPLKDSQNPGWRNASFRGFADYMQSEEFRKNLSELLKLARKKKTAMVCAEAVPWRCHRNLIADALTIREVKVGHIVSRSVVREHTLTPFASVSGGRISYPAESGEGSNVFTE